jgi:hypothetical protein
MKMNNIIVCEDDIEDVRMYVDLYRPRLLYDYLITYEYLKKKKKR